ncbi:transposase [Candidatus Saganbacteria bacterium]|nr:transposase [Candidatus Saganbacteria bacterium]
MIRKKFDWEFKVRVALEAIKGDKSIAEISSEYKVHGTQIAAWKRRALVGMKDFFARGAKPMEESHEQELADLYAQIGRLKVENELQKKRSIRPGREGQDNHGAKQSSGA